MIREASALAEEILINRPLQARVHPDLSVPGEMRRVEFPAMGTTVSLLLPNAQEDEAGAAIRTLFATWESALSRFRNDSELTQLNAAAGRAVAVGELLWTVLTMALDAARATDGLFDPTLRNQLVALGYDRTFEDVRGRAVPASTAPLPGGGWRDVRCDARQHEVTMPRDVTVDLGGIAKGLAVDAAVNCLRSRGVSAALVNAGGDLAVIGLPPESDAWPVAIEGVDGQHATTVPLQRGAIATSGIARRRWVQGNLERHHILDPRTGLPVQSGLWSASVAASHCAQAEVAAKVAFILGPEEGSAFLKAHGLAGLLIGIDGRRHIAGPWPEAVRQ